MTERYEVLGWKGVALSEAAEILSVQLDLRLTLHDSSYRGGDYYRWVGPDRQEIILQENIEDEEGDLCEPDFPDVGVIVYASRLSSTLSARLSNAPGILSLSIDEV